jgi:hypothetical protein
MDDLYAFFEIILGPYSLAIIARVLYVDFFKCGGHFLKNQIVKFSVEKGK